MVKKDDSGSGLRAGFVRSDGLPQQPKMKVPEKIEEPAVKPKPAPVEKPAPEPEELTGPTLTMQGVSGKKITGAVKVIKVPKAEKKADMETEKQAADETTVNPAEKPAVKPVEKKPITLDAEGVKLPATPETDRKSVV